MPGLAFGAGLSPRFSSPPRAEGTVALDITAEAGVTGPSGKALRIVPLVEAGGAVAQGQPVARLKDHEGIALVAPMPARVAHLRLLPGHRLSEIVLFHEAGADRFDHGVRDDADIRSAMQGAGFWPLLRRRPFGGMPAPGEAPAAIVVMAADTRPLAIDPREALHDREEAFDRGLDALTGLTEGPVIVCQSPGPAIFDVGAKRGRVRPVDCGPRHPQGLAGFRIHDLFPASIDVPVWDIHAEDVAALGEFRATGLVPETRLVHVAGAALRESRIVRTQPGADLRGLSFRVAQPGAHVLLSGSPIDGSPAHWLAARDRQVSVLPRDKPPVPRHWIRAALTRSRQPAPVIPTAALEQAFGAALPAAALVRALTSGDDESAMGLDVLSLLEEDLALADYILGGEAHLVDLLRVMLDRIEAEFAP